MTKTPTKPTILLAEDNPQMRKLLSDFLSNDYKVLSVADSLETMEIYREHQEQIAAVIINAGIPPTDRPDFLEWLQKQKEGLPIILISNGSGNVVMTASLQKSNLELLRKPFQFEELLTILKKQLKNADTADK